MFIIDGVSEEGSAIGRVRPSVRLVTFYLLNQLCECHWHAIVKAIVDIRLRPSVGAAPR